MKREMTKERLSKSAASGAVALIFLILGFQLAVFVMKVVERPPSEEAPEAEYAVEAAPGPVSETTVDSAAAPRQHSSGTSRPRSRYGGYEAPEKPYSRQQRKMESFPFDPNAVTLEELVRLGLSERQAQSILNYREKGGRFRSKEDFKKMYVVSDSLYERLEPFIDIPKLELNAADSAALATLQGIGNLTLTQRKGVLKAATKILCGLVKLDDATKGRIDAEIENLTEESFSFPKADWENTDFTQKDADEVWDDVMGGGDE